MSSAIKALLSALLVFASAPAWAQGSGYEYYRRTQITPEDYLLGSHGQKRDPAFDAGATIDLGISLGIGADCGRINIQNTLKGALENALNSNYFENVGRDIIGASPLLLACYASPTWCSILKQGRLEANFLASLRMDQCKAIDRYTDSRVEDFEQERQQCIRREIQNTGGNFELAMDRCQNTWGADLASWAGEGRGKTAENRLLESSAEWAGFSGPEADRTVSLVKAFVGDTIIKHGRVSVDFGPGARQLSPRTHLLATEGATNDALCNGLLAKVMRQGGTRAPIDRIVTDEDLKMASGPSDTVLIDRQTIRSLAYLPERSRDLACRKLADAMAMTVFTRDMSRALDFLTVKVATNPNLPEHRKLEVERKRQALKDQIEVTLTLNRQKSEPLNNVLYQINAEGDRYQRSMAEDRVRADDRERQAGETQAAIWDCADRIFCQ